MDWLGEKKQVDYVQKSEGAVAEAEKFCLGKS